VTIGELSAEEERFVNARIVEFNDAAVSFTQTTPFVRVARSLRNEDGKLAGGIVAVRYLWNVLFIEALWVDANERKRGHGSALLLAVEDEGRDAGCALAHLDTFDFQARDFYIRHGYEVFGELPDCPPGHTRYFMKKSF
jgi:GNAT superfamily N-acetyltransferase